MNDDLCFPCIFLLPSLFLSSPPLARHTACCAHGITADRSLFDQLVMLFLLKIGGREMGGASIRTIPPVRIIFPFTPISLSFSRTTWHRRNLYFPLDRLSTRQENRITCRRVMTFRLPQIHYNYRVWRELSCIDRWKLGNIVANSWKTQRKIN